MPASKIKGLSLKTILVIIALIFLGYVFFSGNKGLLRWAGMSRQKARLEREITALKQENERIRGELAKLKEDTSAVERIAREELGLAKKGEVIYRFVESPGSKKGLTEKEIP